VPWGRSATLPGQSPHRSVHPDQKPREGHHAWRIEHSLRRKCGDLKSNTQTPTIDPQKRGGEFTHDTITSKADRITDSGSEEPLTAALTSAAGRKGHSRIGQRSFPSRSLPEWTKAQLRDKYQQLVQPFDMFACSWGG